MEFKQVYLYDGTPYLAFKGEDGEFKYPTEDAWTEEAPPEGIYQPFYFDGNEWKGATKEEWVKTLPEAEEVEPTTEEIMMAETQVAVAESTQQLKETQEMLAQTLLDNAEKESRIKMLEEQQAQMMLAVAEMKGGEAI
ncbi:hypothetical protein HR081_09890 [Staphylococcus schleiferi subsp. coagulans]|uniref:Uncharacterized protein n=1 Tax=Staphylococcus coagulans TaxID=74706 RepID=A0A9X0PHE4_9STAP|nr:hypothetical protein [Staphylococcus coagulans]MBA8777184.1 hypothetical protein [Staphylococcus coagulans]